MPNLYWVLKPMAVGPLNLTEPSRSGSGVSEPNDHGRDVELVRKALDGETAAIDELVERLQCIPRVLGFVNQRMGGAFDSAELAEVGQEVLASFWSRIADYSGKAALETWAYGFCVNIYLSTLRRRRAHPSARLDEEKHADERDGQRFTDDYVVVRRSLESLDSREERVIRLKFFDNLTFEEIGQRLDLSPNSVKTCFYRGMRRLETLLRQRGAESL